jgi:TRAP-type C4-dicarboxylate transport system permease small subunit
MNRLYNSWRSFQDNFLQYLSAILLVGLTLLALLEVVRRYVFGVSFEWQQDLVTFGILSGIFLFFGITQTRKAHLRVSALLLLLSDKCGQPGRLIASFAQIFSQLLAVWICTYIVWTSIDHLFYLIKEGRKTESLYFSMWPFFF